MQFFKKSAFLALVFVAGNVVVPAQAGIAETAKYAAIGLVSGAASVGIPTFFGCAVWAPHINELSSTSAGALAIGSGILGLGSAYIASYLSEAKENKQAINATDALTTAIGIGLLNNALSPYVEYYGKKNPFNFVLPATAVFILKYLLNTATNSSEAKTKTQTDTFLMGGDF